MKNWMLAAAVTAALGLLGCEGAKGSTARSSGSVALSSDDALIYAADPDSDQVFVVDARTLQLVERVRVGPSPERLLVAPDDTLFVTNRYGRSVSVIRRGEWSEAARLEVGVEPVGMSLSPDGQTLYVVSATARDSAAFGVLTAIDLATLQPKWELPVGPEPRAVAVVSPDRALVSLYKRGDVVKVDLAHPAVLSDRTELYTQANRTALGGAVETSSSPSVAPDGMFFATQTVRPRGMADLAVSPDGRVYAPTLWASEGVLGQNDLDPSLRGGGGNTYGGGPCTAGAVSAPGLVTFTAQGEPLVDDLSSCQKPQTESFPASVLSTQDANSPVQGPVAVVADSTGSWLFVVNHESNNVAVVASARGEPSLDGRPMRHLVTVGGGPTGIALAQDGKRAYVYNKFDHSLSLIESTGGSTPRLTEVGRILVGAEVLAPDVAAGRRLFFSAVDSRMNNPATGISCASCHLEGREDGHVWQFAEGPRQTPSLAGRMTSSTAPFHWNGEFPTLDDFMSHTVQRRMGGTGANSTLIRQVQAFIDTLPAADNPHRLAAPSPAQQRGEQVFHKAQCGACHAGVALTDNRFAAVGTFVTRGPHLDDLTKLPNGLNTPSLLGLARTAPYLHDGSATSLKERILVGKEANLHGLTSPLTDAEVDDLVEYLQSL